MLGSAPHLMEVQLQLRRIACEGAASPLCGGRWDLVEQLRHSRNNLRGRERLGQKNAVGYAVRRPLISSGASHIDDGHLWIDLSGLLGNVPASELAYQMNICEQSTVFSRFGFEQDDRFLA